MIAGSREKGGLEVTARVSFCGDGNVEESGSGDGCEHCEYAKNHSVVHLKKVNFMLCELHLNFKNMKKIQ